MVARTAELSLDKLIIAMEEELSSRKIFANLGRKFSVAGVNFKKLPGKEKSRYYKKSLQGCMLHLRRNEPKKCWYRFSGSRERGGSRGRGNRRGGTGWHSNLNRNQYGRGRYSEREHIQLNDHRQQGHTNIGWSQGQNHPYMSAQQRSRSSSNMNHHSKHSGA